jgi:Cd2+/Zn2+-exporting ATPase
MPSAENETPPPEGGPRLWSDPVRRGFLLTGLTLAGVLCGFWARHAGWTAVEWGCWALAFLAGGIPAARTAVRELWSEHKLDVDLLMVVAALGAASVGQAGDGGILLFLFSLSNTLQAWAFTRTRNAIEALMALHPEKATRLGPGGEEEIVPLEALAPGDRVLVRPGERFPADATVAEGCTCADESALTGESVPVDKAPGDSLFSGTLNGDGVVQAIVTHPAAESTLARLVRLVEEAQAAKSPTEQFAERLEGPYSVGVLLSVPVVFGVLYGIVGMEAGAAWYRAMTFLVVASPCAVVISTPAAVLSAMAAGARSGTLFKSGAALEALAQARIVAFDKTGTLTQGKMELVETVPLDGEDEESVRALAAGLERHSEHPVARAVAAAHRGEVPLVAGVQAVRGMGIRGELEGETVWAGTRRMAAAMGTAPGPRAEERLRGMEERGFTTLLLGRGPRVVAVLAVCDTPRPEAAVTVAALRRAGTRVVMLTGDREAVARHVAGQLGVDEVRAELLPEHKLDAIAALRREGRVAMVGDGVNDAPALAAADVGVAMGSGSDVSLDSADLVLMKSDLSRIPAALELARRTSRTVRFNLTFALGVIVVVGCLSLLGRVPLPLGVVAHEGGTLFVVAMGLRLLAFRPAPLPLVPEPAAECPLPAPELPATACPVPAGEDEASAPGRVDGRRVGAGR